MSATTTRHLDRTDIPADVSAPLADLAAEIFDHGASSSQREELAAFLPTLTAARMGETFTDYMRAATAFVAAYIEQARTFTPEHVKRSGAFVLRDTVTDDDTATATHMIETCRTYLAAPELGALEAVAEADNGFCETEGLPFSVVNSLTETLGRMAACQLANPTSSRDARNVLMHDMTTIACDNDTDLVALLSAVRDEFTN